MASDSNPEIPKKSKAAVVVDEGPDFRVEIQEVDVPEPGELRSPAYRSNGSQARYD